MNNKINNKFKKLSNELYDIFYLLHSFNESCINFNDQWALRIPDISFTSFIDHLKEYQNEREKLMNRFKTCVVFGETTAGKSATINAILGDEILTSSNGRTTNCFVKITKGLQDKRYIWSDNEEKETEYLQKLNDSDNLFASDVDFFYGPSWPFSDDIMVIDTPGIDVYDITDQDIENCCKDAILVLLVIDGKGTISKKIRKFVEKFKTKFLKMHIFIVINKWDEIKENEMRRVECQHMKFSSEILCNQLSYTQDDAKESTFFISALRQLTSPNDNPFKENFAKFKKKFEIEMRDKERKFYYLEELYRLLECELKKSKEMTHSIENKIKEINKTSVARGNKIEIVKNEVVNAFPLICRNFHEKFIDEFVKFMDKKITKWEIESHEEKENQNDELRAASQNIGYVESGEVNIDFDNKSVASSTHDDVSETTPLLEQSTDVVPSIRVVPGREKTTEEIIREEKIETLLSKCIDNLIEQLEIAFVELIFDQNDEYLRNRLGLVNLSYRLNADKENLLSSMSRLMEIIEMHKKNEKLKIIVGVTTGISAAAVAATGGVLGAVVAPIEFTTLEYCGIGAAASFGGAALGGGGSVGMIELIKKISRNPRAGTECETKDGWQKLEERIIETLIEFLQSFNLLEDTFKPLKESLKSIEEKIEAVRGKILTFN